MKLRAAELAIAGLVIAVVAMLIVPLPKPLLDILPNFSMGELGLMIFIMPLAISWWAVWYPGSEPGGGSYIAQRMLASKSEKDSLGGTLFFNLAHYVLRPWPWIIIGVESIATSPPIMAAIPNEFAMCGSLG